MERLSTFWTNNLSFDNVSQAHCDAYLTYNESNYIMDNN